jgi:extracellular factor (EF) 3-hydroxypalmitic acid methyl ester biosynthesis protein
VNQFLRTSILSSEADFTFMDFDAETLSFVKKSLTEVARSHGRHTGIETIQSSVQQLLRKAIQSRKLPAAQQYDMIYCAGLFDYLSSATCKALVGVCHEWLNPGGLVVAANMNDSQPFRNMIEFLLDWYLIYRDAAFMGSLRPDAPDATAQVIAEPTTINLFVHVRKALQS